MLENKLIKLLMFMVLSVAPYAYTMESKITKLSSNKQDKASLEKRDKENKQIISIFDELVKKVYEICSVNEQFTSQTEEQATQIMMPQIQKLQPIIVPMAKKRKEKWNNLVKSLLSNLEYNLKNKKLFSDVLKDDLVVHLSDNGDNVRDIWYQDMLRLYANDKQLIEIFPWVVAYSNIKQETKRP